MNGELKAGADVLLQLDRFGVKYGAVRAIDDISLSLKRGDLVGLIGPNGAGKTTFIDGVTGLTPSTGAITFAGVRLDKMPAHRRVRAGLARTFQSLELFEELTVKENLSVYADRRTWWRPLVDLVLPRPPKGSREVVQRALESVGLEDLAERRPTELSLGQRKLVTVARALAAEPSLLLLDEPAAGLDTEESEALGEALQAVVRQGTTTLLVDHDMSLVLGICDVVHVLDFGQLIASGPPAAIRTDARVIAAYLGANADAARADGHGRSQS